MTTRSWWFLPAARWYALPWPRCQPRAATPWASCSLGPRTRIASLRSRGTGSEAWPRTQRPPNRNRPPPTPLLRPPKRVLTHEHGSRQARQEIQPQDELQAGPPPLGVHRLLVGSEAVVPRRDRLGGR